MGNEGSQAGRTKDDRQVDAKEGNHGKLKDDRQRGKRMTGRMNPRDVRQGELKDHRQGELKDDRQRVKRMTGSGK